MRAQNPTPPFVDCAAQTTFLDYLKPTATDVPEIEVERLEHPSPFTPLGAKGVGEGGAIPEDYAFHEGADGRRVRLSELFAPGKDSLVL